jgi:hypothetical protein
VWFLNKNNGKPGPKGLRGVHGLLGPAKVFLAVLWDMAGAPSAPNFSFGISGRRLEEPIAIQLILTNKLNQARIPHLRKLRDTANAFPSLSHAALDAAIEFVKDDFIHDTFVDHYQKSIFTMSVGEECLSFHPMSGVLPGSSVGCHFVHYGVWPAFAEWRERRVEMSKETWLEHPVSKAVVDPSLTTYVDDAGSVITGKSVAEFIERDSVDDYIFNDAMHKVGVPYSFFRVG